MYETVQAGAWRRCGLLSSGGNSLQAQHLLPRPGFERDATGARGRLHRGECAVRIDLGEVGQAIVFNERAQADQPLVLRPRCFGTE